MNTSQKYKITRKQGNLRFNNAEKVYFYKSYFSIYIQCSRGYIFILSEVLIGLHSPDCRVPYGTHGG